MAKTMHSIAKSYMHTLKKSNKFFGYEVEICYQLVATILNLQFFNYYIDHIQNR